MKTEKELNDLKEKYAELNKKLAELGEDELRQVIGGGAWEPQYEPSLKPSAGNCHIDGGIIYN